ncbi:PREDICTED: uncharacterized protein LOC108609819 [Drosophila arizonae]|uniref:Uncharacterized protein LOC108609819 n=1 Tax=Drosophila arizonae TaxID=7263 RepID=A0ABM1NQ27_DROAR|nr:PREDICTED: uncharacterized protein LOC108609819 [Drosophila arizonae]
MKRFHILIFVFVLYELVICNDLSSEEDESDDLNSGYTIGRTRNTLRTLARESKGNSESYCCFWIYQDHPALPDAVDLQKKYPFDFIVNGKILVTKLPTSSTLTYITTKKM